MIIYNVTIKVQHDIAAEWLEWMKKEHMPELMKTGLFLDYRLCRLLEQDELEGITYTAQYFCDSLEHYNTYVSEHAQKMRDKSFARFGNKFIAFRTVMEVES
jgi:predicted ATP-dependent Lon-type protease